jgi:hypothetical protein
MSDELESSEEESSSDSESDSHGSVRGGSQTGRDSACAVPPRSDASLSVQVNGTGGASSAICRMMGLKDVCRCSCHRLHSKKMWAASSWVVSPRQQGHRVVQQGSNLPQANICAAVATVVVRKREIQVIPVTRAGSHGTRAWTRGLSSYPRVVYSVAVLASDSKFPNHNCSFCSLLGLLRLPRRPFGPRLSRKVTVFLALHANPPLGAGNPRPLLDP